MASHLSLVPFFIRWFFFLFPFFRMFFLRWRIGFIYYYFFLLLLIIIIFFLLLMFFPLLIIIIIRTARIFRIIPTTTAAAAGRAFARIIWKSSLENTRENVLDVKKKSKKSESESEKLFKYFPSHRKSSQNSMIRPMTIQQQQVELQKLPLLLVPLNVLEGHPCNFHFR